MGVMNVEDSEIAEIKKKFSILVDMFRDILHSKAGFMITCCGVRFFDHGVLVLPVQVGKKLLHVFRVLLSENFAEYLIDMRFVPHISVFRKNKINDIDKEQLGHSLEEFNTGTFVCEKVSLRAIKTTENKSPGDVCCESLV